MSVQTTQNARWGGLKGIPKEAWIVLAACYAGGMFDGLDSTLFTAALPVAIPDLVGSHDPILVSKLGGWVSALFLLGWTLGGVIFGVISDRFGRVKALSLSILIYALSTGLCGLAQSWEQLALFRFLTALGIGGELIVGTTLVAESWPEQYRVRAVGVLTTAYQVGVTLVGVSNMALGQLSWRYLFFLGALPALLVMVLRRTLKEPALWDHHPEPHVSIWTLFSPIYLRSVLAAGTFTGVMLVAYWASSFWIPTWVHQLLPGPKPVTQVSLMVLTQGLFAIAGATWAGFLAEQIGRRWTVVVANVGYLLATIGMFSLNPTFTPWLYGWSALLGFFIGINISICYIYVPELFPTRLRSTGTGFCFNIGRIAAALGTLYSAHLVALFGGNIGLAAQTVSYILVLALVAVCFAPETKGQTLRHAV